MFKALRTVLFFAAVFPLSADTDSGDLRVSVVLNADGSRTTYETDAANHKSVATTTASDGRFREKIRYELDGTGRFARGEVFGPKGEFRFRAIYHYDPAGHVREELRERKDGSSLGKIVFQYDDKGHQSGYAVYDAKGKLLGQTAAAQPSSRQSR